MAQADIDGETWTVRKGPKDRTTYVRSEGGVTTLVVGTASRSVIEDYISSLSTRPGRADQNGAGSSSTGTLAAGGELCVLVDLAVGAPPAYGAPGAVRAGTRVPLRVDVPVARRGGDVGPDRFGQSRLLEVPRIDLAGVRRQHLDLDRRGRAAVRLGHARGEHRQQERDLQVVGIDVVGAAGRQGPGGLDLAGHEPVADAEHESGFVTAMTSASWSKPWIAVSLATYSTPSVASGQLETWCRRYGWAIA